MIFAGLITKNSIEFLAGLTGLLVSIILVIHYLRLAER
jgi:hypothetical protein